MAHLGQWLSNYSVGLLVFTKIAQGRGGRSSGRELGPEICFNLLYRPLDNIGLSCVGALTHGFFFQHIHTKIPCDLGWLNPWMGNHGHGGLTIKLYVDFRLCGSWCPDPHFVQGSTLYILGFRVRCYLEKKGFCS